MKLESYRKKRDPARTNEPFGPEPPAGVSTRVGAYVVHLHHATRVHYDLRIEIGGTLASFAVPKGPSLDPEAKHLAVHTEDHPIEYLDFEGIIPGGQYGAGPMIAWDRGTVRYLEAAAEDGMASGKIDLNFTGQKLAGRFALVKLKDGAMWLLLKKRDAFASADDLLVTRPRSVLSGLTIEELPGAPGIAEELRLRAAALGAKARTGKAAITPLALRVARAIPPEKDWLYEVKLDGARALVERSGEDAVVLHDGRDVSDLYPEVTAAARALLPIRAVLDGDLVALEGGRPSLARLTQRIGRMRDPSRARLAALEAPVVFVACDLLAIADLDLRPLPLVARKELLRALVRGQGLIRTSEVIDRGAASALEFCRVHGLEGIVAKKRASAYKKAADGAWLLVRAEGAEARPHVLPEPEEAMAEGAAPAQAEPVAPASKAPASFTVTNRAKVFWPEDHLTKGDLCDYYAAIAATILPYLRDRPLALVRYPDGIHGKHFFQWNVPPGLPPFMKTLALRPDEDAKGERTIERRGFLVNDARSLVAIANLGCIPMHVLGWRTPMLDDCDFLTIDFDVGQSTLVRAVEQSRTLKAALEGLGLVGYPKTSGQSGLHVLVPLGPRVSFDTAKTFAELLGRYLVKCHPEHATMERVVSRRGEKVYVDTGQTGQGRTIVCPYSVRAVPGATVSTPLTWDEVVPELDPRRFSIRTVPARLAATPDPMAHLLGERPDVPAAVAGLRALFR